MRAQKDNLVFAFIQFSATPLPSNKVPISSNYDVNHCPQTSGWRDVTPLLKLIRVRITEKQLWTTIDHFHIHISDLHVKDFISHNCLPPRVLSFSHHSSFFCLHSPANTPKAAKETSENGFVFNPPELCSHNKINVCTNNMNSLRSEKEKLALN